MVRPWLVLAASGAAVGAVLTGVGACGGDRDDVSAEAPDGGSAGIDAAFVVDAAAPAPPDLEPPPVGDVCGDGAGLQAEAPWPLRGGCVTRAGWSATSGPETSAVRWIAPVSAGDSSPAVSATGTLWVGTMAGDVLALNASGAVTSGHRTAGEVRSSPAIDANGNAIVGSSDGTLYALAEGAPGVDDGDAAPPPYPPAKVVFSLSLGPIASSPVIGRDGTIYVTTTEGELVAVFGDGSARRWVVTTNDVAGSSPAIGQDGTVYVGSSNHKLYAVHPDGTTKWTRDLGAPIDASPAIGGDGTIFIGTEDGRLHAVDVDGEPRWSYAAGGPIRSTPAVYAGTVYVGSEDQKLHAVAVADGARRWTYETRGAVAAPVIDLNGVVYFGAADARLYAVSAKGTLLFAVNTKGKVTGAPAIGFRSTLFVGTDTGIVAVGP